MRIPLSLLLFIIFSCCILQSHLSLGEIEVQQEQQEQQQQEEGAIEGGEAAAEESSSEEGQEGVQYFYHGFPDAGDILEYEATEGEWDGISPDYIYQPDKVRGIRIVEFYAHWW